MGPIFSYLLSPPLRYLSGERCDALYVLACGFFTRITDITHVRPKGLWYQFISLMNVAFCQLLTGSRHPQQLRGCLYHYLGFQVCPSLRTKLTETATPAKRSWLLSLPMAAFSSSKSLLSSSWNSGSGGSIVLEHIYPHLSRPSFSYMNDACRYIYRYDLANELKSCRLAPGSGYLPFFGLRLRISCVDLHPSIYIDHNIFSDS